MSARRKHEMVAEGQERVMSLLDRIEEKIDAVMREGLEEIEQIRREVLDATGVDIRGVSSPEVPAVLDLLLGDLALLAGRCRHLLAGVELLGDHVRLGSTRTVGAAVKAGVDRETASKAVFRLQQSGFFGTPDEGVSP